MVRLRARGGKGSLFPSPPPAAAPPDSELVCVGLQSKCEKWVRHKWVGSRGPLAHKDLWTELWERWQLLGDSVEILWVPSHVGVAGNEEADVRAAKGAKQALQDVQKAKQVTDIWEELGLEEMPDSWDTNSNRSTGQVCPATALKNILMSGPSNRGCGENQPMKHSIALRGELKATFSTGSSCDLWPVTRGSYGS